MAFVMVQSLEIYKGISRMVSDTVYMFLVVSGFHSYGCYVRLFVGTKLKFLHGRKLNLIYSIFTAKRKLS